MALIELTMLSRDKNTNGRTLYIKHDTIVGMTDAEMKSDDVVIIGSTTEIPGTMIWLSNGKNQFVSQNMDSIRKQVQDAIKTENTRYHVTIPHNAEGVV